MGLFSIFYIAKYFRKGYYHVGDLDFDSLTHVVVKQHLTLLQLKHSLEKSENSIL